MQDPQPDFQPRTGIAETLAPGLRRVLAPNPSPMTFRGTNTYLLGTGGIAVIDPGPDDPTHLQALLDALTPGQEITHILVTHAHLDHSPLARDLSRRTGAPVLGFGPAQAGRSAIMRKLADEGLVGGGEGVDSGFVPDIVLADGDTVAGDGWTVEALHTPGHMANHLSFAWGDVLFSGDLVMGWATSLVSPPDGDLTAFMCSLERLQERPWSLFHAGHGAPVTAPAERLEALLTHRRGRETAILEALTQTPATARDLAERIYTDVPPALLPAATRNVLAHLIDLTSKSRVALVGDLSAEAVFRSI
ncbi:Glyoxylase, beta-lactamase superfamily II [Mameliella alba]|uniref:MBL fold metallo-hydrolase n=1 Tax=Mameliella alba TaxID=561184 RepID=UPI00088863F9|nr:MBL fold metallo-hydrolase [Mameliella alba]OWV50045.1 MBL fold metallo-hydrolase [Mameliella alba]PTR42575.1 glyoxylase-like metal-dependent hydrolase (beta-lactamase superfamily II) [Mameliella alba]GGF72017.1 MBL fold hydrolase [Mameliella alba]SDC16211.1 Glyoxylase, beta-lactamase superfamily II [Mameliella alba]